MEINKELFKGFAFYAACVTTKTMLMAPLTGCARFKTGTFSNEEDIVLSKGSKVSFTEETVERIRRCHLNDMENVFPFVLLGPLYLATNPCPHLAMALFRGFAITRVLHTITYVQKVRQPCRFIFFLGGLGINFFMAGCIIKKFLN